MKDKLIKLSFPTHEEWETVRETLVNADGSNIEGLKSIINLGHMQKPPRKEGEEWGLYDDWAIDLITRSDFDHTELEKWLVESESEDNFRHKPAGGNYEIIYKKI